MLTFESTLSNIASVEPKQRGALFEQLCCDFLRTQVPENWRILTWKDTPPSIKDRLGLPSHDIGVDGVIISPSQRLYIWQAKYRSRPGALSWRECSTFLALAGKADGSWLLTNAARLSTNAALPANCSLTLGADFSGPLPVKAAVTDLQARLIPRDDQLEAIAAVTAAFRSHDRAQVWRACGTGKTLIGMEVAETLHADTLLVLAPSLVLVRQHYAAWKRAGLLIHRSVAVVCSDADVHEDARSGVPVLSDVDAVATYATGAERKIVFCTYHSFPLLAPLQRANLALCDEAHRLAGDPEGRFADVLFDDTLHIERRLFMTATARLRDPEWEDDRVIGMDDVELFGPVVHELSFREAIERELICDYDLYMPIVELPAGTESAAISPAWWARAIEPWFATQETRHLLTCHNRTEDARTFSQHLKLRCPSVVSAVIDGRTPGDERAKRIQEFANAPMSTLSQVRCLSEGMDVPGIDAVAFLANKQSFVDIVQTIGRAVRKEPSKHCAKIIVPVVVPSNASASFVAECFDDQAIGVLAALRQLDSAFCDILKAWQKGRRPSVRLHIGPSRWSESLDLGLLGARLASLALGERQLGFLEHLRRLEQYRLVHGDADVPAKWPEDSGLAAFVVKTRTERRRGKLATWQIDRLNALGFSWEPQAGWKEGLADLRAFAQKHGHLDVTDSYPNQRLVRWIRKQRHLARTGRLCPNRRALLIEAGLSLQPVQARGIEMIHHLAAFKRQFGHLKLPKSASNWLPARSWWYRFQRQLKEGTADGTLVLQAQVAGLLDVH